MTIIAADALSTTSLETHTVIIGAGPGGLTVAGDLNKDVIVLEAGSDKIERDWQARQWAFTQGVQNQLNYVRVRGIGGATLQWTGRCIELDGYDFEDRPWVAAHGWPITKADLAPWYRQAWNTLRIDRGMISQRMSRVYRSAMEVSNDQNLQLSNWHYTPSGQHLGLNFMDLAKQHFRSEKKKLIYRAEATCLLFENGRLCGVETTDRRGRLITIQAKRVVLAAGCLGNCRTLLLTQRTNPDLFEPVEKWLGAGFMQHLRVEIGRLRAAPESFKKIQNTFNRFVRPNVGYFETGLAIQETFARKRALGNASIFFQYVPDWSKFSPRKLGVAIQRLKSVQPIFPSGQTRVIVDAEQAITKDSRIVLSEEVDEFGLNRPIVDWKVAPVDEETIRVCATEVSRFLEQRGFGSITLDPALQRRHILAENILNSAHPLGGTRMSQSPNDGVVNRDSQVHGIENLYVTGGSVFATGGHANPTLTIVALAHRLAKHLNTSALV